MLYQTIGSLFISVFLLLTMRESQFPHDHALVLIHGGRHVWNDVTVTLSL